MTSPAPRQTDLGAPGLELLLYGLQSPINIGMILRIAEAYGARVAILDLHRVLDDAQKLGTIRDFGCGALARRGYQRLEDTAGLAQLCHGRRMIATSIGCDAVPLPDFVFMPGDIIALGNEYDGLPDAVVHGASVLVHVPLPPGWLPRERTEHPIDPARTTPVARDGQPSLNVAVTAGIICYAAYAQRSPTPAF